MIPPREIFILFFYYSLVTGNKVKRPQTCQ
jgi:hypothetical protein